MQLLTMKMLIINGFSLSMPGMSGIKRNTLELLKKIDKITDQECGVSVAVPKLSTVDIGVSNIKIEKLDAGINTGNGFVQRKIRRLFWMLVSLNREKKKKDALLIDTTLDFPRGADVIMIYDCIPELFPNCFSTFKGVKYRAIIRIVQSIAIRTCKLIITDSESAASDISSVYKVKKDKIKVIPCAWDHFLDVVEEDRVIKQLNLPKEEYFFALGNSMKHKNIQWVIEAAKQNPNELFVISGAKPNNQAHCEDNLIYTGCINDGEMKSLMKHCKAFIFPSFYEGFGIPPMEAMSVGADCIVAKSGSLPEVYKNSVWYIDPHNYEKINLEEIMANKKAPNELILKEYSWEKSAAMLLDAVKDLRN